MKLSLPARLLAFFSAALIALAPSVYSAEKVNEETSPATDPICTYSLPHSASAPILYTLNLTFPSSGYSVHLLGHTLSAHNVHLNVHYLLEPGIHLAVLTTHRVYFELVPPHTALTFTVTVNGISLGAPRFISVK